MEDKIEKCIITIEGNKYDVTELKNTHPGGDVFKDGKDMTAVYNAQHSNIDQMKKYLVTSDSSASISERNKENVSNTDKLTLEEALKAELE